MINVQLKNNQGSYSVLLSQRIVSMGRNTQRHVVEADVYVKDNETKQLMFMTRGISILNPLDKFDARLGALKATENAVAGMFERPQRKEFLKEVGSWFE